MTALADKAISGLQVRGDNVAAALDRNLCRCGTHVRFVDAVLAAAGSTPEAGQ